MPSGAGSVIWSGLLMRVTYNVTAYVRSVSGHLQVRMHVGRVRANEARYKHVASLRLCPALRVWAGAEVAEEAKIGKKTLSSPLLLPHKGACSLRLRGRTWETTPRAHTPLCACAHSPVRVRARTSVMERMTSSGSLLARAYVCITAVRKALGLNKPGSHTLSGVMMSPWVQLFSWS